MLEKRCYYRAFGLVIASELTLPELSPIIDFQESIDVEIKYESISDLHELEKRPYYHFVKDNQVFFNIPSKGNFSVRDGNMIIVSPINEVDEDVLRLYILGTCMGVILMQRNIIPLHGSAIEIDGKAYAFVGDSGAGKSTLASAFINRGYKLLSDDVIPITLTDESSPVILPAYPQQKLWQQSLSHFGMDSRQYQPIYERETKFSVPVTENFSDKVIPLAGVYELKIGGDIDAQLSKIEGLPRLSMMFQHTYRNFLIPRLELTEWHFKTSAQLISYIEIFTLTRPKQGFTVNQLLSIILESIKKETVKC